MTALELFNTCAALVLSLIAGWAAMSNRTRTNLAVHVGLVLIALGFLGAFLMAFGPFTYVSAISASNAIVHFGLVLCAIGYLQRAFRKGTPCRRSSDWMSLEGLGNRRSHNRRVTDICEEN
jgi:CHASE2 domain-containing sensor protein